MTQAFARQHRIIFQICAIITFYSLQAGINPLLASTQNERPTISLNGETTIAIRQGYTFKDPGATAYDFEDGDVTNKITIDYGDLNTNIVGSYFVTYSVRDSSGESISIGRVVDVIGKPVRMNLIKTSNPFSTEAQTARFLNQATFGAKYEDIRALTGTSVSEWLLRQFELQPSLHLKNIQSEYPLGLEGESAEIYMFADSNSWWKTSIVAQDQLRQRMAFALSQILVLANPPQSELADKPTAMAYYMDILTKNAFGNYRQLLEEVTYSPAMGIYLTFEGNEKANPEEGNMPDENYAREIMQLFTIGLVELEIDGRKKLNAKGEQIETYTNEDITGLAKVFTGLNIHGDDDEPEESPALYTRPMVMYEEDHSQKEKNFLGRTIPAGTGGTKSIKLALDYIFAHPNVGPFVGRQLIQRFTKSHPSPPYVQRVAAAFNTGKYTLGNGTVIGTGERGDLKATIAAVLLDTEVRSTHYTETPRHGKVREPVVRFTQWARAFNVKNPDPRNEQGLYQAMRPSNLAQHAYKSRSVFNFFRPGYIAPGTRTGASRRTMPELQIVNESTSVGYASFMGRYIRGRAQKWEDPEDLEEIGIHISSAEHAPFIADYAREISLANTPDALVDHLDLLLTGNRLQQSTKDRIVSVLREIPVSSQNKKRALRERVHIAILMAMTAPGYIVQR